MSLPRGPRSLVVRLQRFSCGFTASLSTDFSLLASGRGYRLQDIEIICPWAMPAADSRHGGAGGMGFMASRLKADQATD
ncbi:MAG: hypothetical protein JNM60_00335 [Candidatus Competibacteraceae bacterium]|nr:hypothetical protein [Candidatus Competibacteraceae bacterium]